MVFGDFGQFTYRVLLTTHKVSLQFLRAQMLTNDDQGHTLINNRDASPKIKYRLHIKKIFSDF